VSGLVDVRTACESYRATGEDRVAVIDSAGGCVIVVADGVGGRSYGAEAAERIVQTVRHGTTRLPDIADGSAWSEVLADADRRFAGDPTCGETTSVVIGIDRDGVAGASVGDSGAWIITRSAFHDLTCMQHRKPFLGSGAALSVSFHRPFAVGDTLLVATDGLLKYTSPSEICRVVRSTELDVMSTALIDLVRLRSGALQDDVALAVARRI
jgi:serine/threonine protein phosphatase PrpC